MGDIATKYTPGGGYEYKLDETKYNWVYLDLVRVNAMTNFRYVNGFPNRLLDVAALIALSQKAIWEQSVRRQNNRSIKIFHRFIRRHPIWLKRSLFHTKGNHRHYCKKRCQKEIKYSKWRSAHIKNWFFYFGSRKLYEQDHWRGVKSLLKQQIGETLQTVSNNDPKRH